MTVKTGASVNRARNMACFVLHPGMFFYVPRIAGSMPKKKNSKLYINSVTDVINDDMIDNG